MNKRKRKKRDKKLARRKAWREFQERAIATLTDLVYGQPHIDLFPRSKP